MMYIRVAFSALLAIALLFVQSPAAAAHATQLGPGDFGPAAVLVDFDHAPDGSPIPSGTLLGSTYQGVGVTFGPLNYVCDWCGIPKSLPNRCTSGGPVGSTIQCSFPVGVTAVGAYGFDFVLTVFDEHGAPLGSCAYTDGTAGIFGGDREQAFLGLASTQKIYRAEFGLYWNQQAAYGFEIDDLIFLPAAQPTPVAPRTFGSLKAAYR